jgi:branched-chain amino acid transport system substrate-binding protein
MTDAGQAPAKPGDTAISSSKRLILATAAAFACASGLTVDAHAAGDIDIGLIADMTGPAALSGKHKVNGAKLAIDEINASGGINGQKIKLFIEDDQGKNQAGVSAYEKLASNQNIIAIIGSVRSTIVNATLPYIERDQIPTMIGGTDPKLTRTGNQWVFRFRPNDNYGSQAMANYAVTSMGAKKVAVIYDTDAFGSAGNKLLLAALEKDGASVVSDQGYTTATRDYTSFLERIKSSGADTLATYMTNAEDEAQMLKQLSQLGLDVKIMGSPSIATTVCIQLAGPAVNGTYGVSDFVANGNPQAQAFSAKYEAAYHSPPDLFGGWVYDAINVLSAVIAKDGTSGPAIQKGVRAVKDYHGVEGVYNFDSNGDGLHGYSVVKITDQTVHLIKYDDFSN